MRTLFILNILLLLSFQCKSQEKGDFIQAKTVYSDTNLQSGKAIRAEEYIFSQRLDTLNVVNNNLIAQLRDKRPGNALKHKGKVMNLNLNSGEVQWAFDISYLYERILLSGEHLIYYKAKSSKYLDINTAEKKWWVKNDFVLVDSANNIGIGYKSVTYPKTHNTLEGVDLNSGTSIWSREVNRIEGWHNVQNLNDTAVLIAALGLYKVNTSTGEGWEAFISKGHKPQNNAALVGGVLGGLMGAFIVITISKETSTALERSNLLITEDNIYFAYSGSLYKMDMRGETLWELELKNKNLRNVELFIHGNAIVVINRGSKISGGKKISSGKPLMAIVNTETGELLTNVELGGSATNFLGNYSIKGDTAFFVLNTSILKYHLIQRKLLARMDLPHYNNYKFDRLLKERDYLLKGKRFIPVEEEYPGLLNILCTDKKVRQFGTDVKFKALAKEDKFQLQQVTKYYKVVRSDNSKYILNLKGEAILKVSLEAKIIYCKNHLFVAEENRLRVIGFEHLF